MELDRPTTWLFVTIVPFLVTMIPVPPTPQRPLKLTTEGAILREDRLAGETLDDIACLETRSVGGLFLFDRGDLDTAGSRVFTMRSKSEHLDPEETPANTSVFEDLLQDRPDHVAGYGETDSGILTMDGSVDSDDFAVEIHHRASAVAGVDGGISLNEVLIFYLFDIEVDATGRTDDA